MASLFCSKCLQYFPLTRDNVKVAKPELECPGCKGHGKVKGRDAEGRPAIIECDLCAGGGKLTHRAICSMRGEHGWCQTSRGVPKPILESLSFIGRPDPRDPNATLRRRGLTPRYVRKGSWPTN